MSKTDKLGVKSPFEKYAGSVQPEILEMLPTRELLRLGRFYSKSRESMLEERQSILIELFSRYKNKDDILYQMAYLQSGDLNLFTETLSKIPFTAVLNNAMQSSMSNAEHRFAIVTAWSGTRPHIEDSVIAPLKNIKKEAERAEKEAEDLRLQQEAVQEYTGTKRISALNGLFIKILTLKNPVKNKQMDAFLSELTDPDVKAFTEALLTSLNTEHVLDYLERLLMLEKIAFLLPKMNVSDRENMLTQLSLVLKKFTSNFKTISLLIDCIPVPGNFFEQKLCDTLLDQLQGDIWMIGGAEAKVRGLLVLVQKSKLSLDVESIVNHLFAKLQAWKIHPYLVSMAHQIIATLIPQMQRHDIQKYIDFILEEANSSHTYLKKDAMQAIAYVLPMLTNAADIEQFIQPILANLRDDDAGLSLSALKATASLLPKINNEILQAFIQPVLNYLTYDSRLIFGNERLLLETIAVLLTKLETTERNMVLNSLLLAVTSNRFCYQEKFNLDSANLLSQFIISNQIDKDFIRHLKNAKYSHETVERLQTLMNQWQTITSNRSITSNRNTFGYGSSLLQIETNEQSESEEAPFKKPYRGP